MSAERLALLPRPQQEREEVSGCQNSEVSTMEVSAANHERSKQDPTARQGRRQEALVMPGRHCLDSQRPRRQPFKLPASTSYAPTASRQRHPSSWNEARPNSDRQPSSLAALPTFQVPVRNVRVAKTQQEATGGKSTLDAGASAHDNLAAMSSAARPVGTKREVSARLADGVVCGGIQLERSGT